MRTLSLLLRKPVRASIADEEVHNGAIVNWVRAVGWTAFAALSFTFAFGYDQADWRGGLAIFAVYAPICVGVAVGKRWRAQLARWAAPMTLIDIALIFFIQSRTIGPWDGPIDATASGVAGFTVAVFLLMLVLVGLSLRSSWIIPATLEAIVFEYLLQSQARVGLGGRGASIFLFALAGFATWYTSHRLVRLVLEVDHERELLEDKVKERTAELSLANANLQALDEQKTAVLNALEEKDRLLSEDLADARVFQQSILPRLAPDRGEAQGLEFSAVYRPAGPVGGDIYDIDEVRPGCFRVFLGDATGHGVQASLRTMLIKSEYERTKKSCAGPEDALRRLNAELISNYGSTGIRFAACCFDVAPGAAGGARVHYVNAGHPGIVHVTQGQAREIYSAGTFLGVIEDIDLEPVEVILGAGDRLYAYSDGIYEEWNAAGEELGEARVIEELLRSRAPLPDTLAGLMAWLERFLGQTPLADDITLIGIACR